MKDMNILEIKRIKKEVDYESNIARCGTCIHFKSKRMEMFGSRYKWLPSICKIHNFCTEQYGICNLWTDKQGRVL